MAIRGQALRLSPDALAWTTALIVFVACGAVSEARAQASASSTSSTPSIVVDGTDWMESNADERRAFLVGVANMIVAEGAYAKRHASEMPIVSDRIVKAVANLKLADIEARITRWYETNPTKRSMPVMGVIWQDIVGQRP